MAILTYQSSVLAKQLKFSIGLTLLVFAIAVNAEQDNPSTSQLYLVHFSLGESWDQSLGPAQQAGFKQHSQNLSRLRKAGQIVFGARYSDLGMIVLKATSVAEVTELLQRDPGVVAGIFKFSVEPLNVFYPWVDSTIDTSG